MSKLRNRMALALYDGLLRSLNWMSRFDETAEEVAETASLCRLARLRRRAVLRTMARKK